ncbi:hypothetical protein FRC17_009770 [Serendipita sp. 399]|nr:hypothetical protein FRC17_009770 [Serendipita sp. 399]
MRSPSGGGLLQQLAQSLIVDPIKTSLPIPRKRDDATVDRRGNVTTDDPLLEEKQVFADGNQCSSPSNRVESGPSTGMFLNDEHSGPTSGNAPESVFEERIDSDPFLLINETDFEVFLRSPDPSCSSPPNQENDKSPCKRRKRNLEDDSEEDGIAIEANANKRIKLDISGNVSPVVSDSLRFNFDTWGEDLYPFNDPTYNPWETDAKETKAIDFLSSRGLRSNDNLSSIQSILPLSGDWEECNFLVDAVVASPSADDLFTEACRTMRAYNALVDTGNTDVDMQRGAREEMATAWRRWHGVSRGYIGMRELRQYGKALDAQGRRAMASALEVESSSQLEEWIGSTSQSVPTLGQPPVQNSSAAVSNATNPSPAPAPYQVAASAITFSTTPEGRWASKKEKPEENGKLPSWAEDVLYCASHGSLSQWIHARQADLGQLPSPMGMSGDEEKAVLDELYGPPRANLTPREKLHSREKRACAALPPNQRPVLLDGKAEVEGYTNGREKTDFMLVCRANFTLDGQTFHYRSAVCGDTFRSHDNALRHIKEQHLKKKTRKPSKKSESAAITTTASLNAATHTIPTIIATNSDNATTSTASASPATSSSATTSTNSPSTSSETLSQ